MKQPLSSAAEPARADAQRSVAIWLFVCAAMVFVMVVLGGVTRLTESGLSIVYWHPLTGILPPLSDDAWRSIFDQYRNSPEFERTNFWMTLQDFKGIFWLEFVHRLWGRTIGVVFLLPFLWFLIRGRVERRLVPALVFLFLLGAAQGGLGWYMVKSGLVAEPSVSQYRLAAHLGLAVLIYAFLLWLAQGLWNPGREPAAWGRRVAVVAVVWSFITMMSGAFVAGLDAGMAYNTFPLMDGQLVPDGIFRLTPWPINFFQNTATVQFTHRTLAVSFVLFALATWIAALRRGADDASRRAFGLLALAAVVQATLGISTLLMDVPVPLAALHQTGALVVFTAALWSLFVTRSPHAARVGAAAAVRLDAAGGAR